mmetsp:Transcript_33108/g.71650  ORF Transcript_33108/g.71650 Transcript_33108/m.71650 type:complete len:755 (+) Transcript_33108:240-2504(+)
MRPSTSSAAPLAVLLALVAASVASASTAAAAKVHVEKRGGPAPSPAAVPRAANAAASSPPRDGRLLQWWVDAFNPSPSGNNGNENRPNPEPTRPPPTRPPPTLPTGGNNLQDRGDEPDWKLGRCEGDCDRNNDCQGDLVCFRPDDPKDFVWGCDGDPDSDVNYCIDASDIPPTAAPTVSPSPTAVPTMSPTTGAPTASPTLTPSSSPTVPEKLYMMLDPITVKMTFPDMLEVSNTKKDQRIVEGYLKDIVSQMYRRDFPTKVNKFFWEAEIDVVSVGGYDDEDGTTNNNNRRLASRFSHRRVQEDVTTTGINVHSYEVSGEAAFIDVPDTVLPTREELRSGMANVLNANALYKELTATDHPILGSVQSLDVTWADGNTSMSSSGGDSKGTTQKVFGAILFVIIVVAIGWILYVLRKRKKEGREVWTLKGFIPGYKGKESLSSSVSSQSDDDKEKSKSLFGNNPDKNDKKRKNAADTTMDISADDIEEQGTPPAAPAAATGASPTAKERWAGVAKSSRELWRSVSGGGGMSPQASAFSQDTAADQDVLPSGASEMVSSVDIAVTDTEGGASLKSGTTATGSEFSFTKVGASGTTKGQYKSADGSSGSVYSLPKNYGTSPSDIGDASIDVSVCASDDGSRSGRVSAIASRPLGSVLEADDEGHDTTSTEIESGATPSEAGNGADTHLADMAALMQRTVEKGNNNSSEYLPGGLVAVSSTHDEIDTVELINDNASMISGVTACTGEILAGSTNAPKK